MNVKNNRRENLRLLAQAVGGITSLANLLGKSPSQISHLIGVCVSKNVGDKLAAEIERVFAKPAGWLDGNYVGYEQEIVASAIPPTACYRVPLLKKREVANWILHPQQRTDKHLPQFLYTSAAVSAEAFAYQLQTDCMEASSGISFPGDSILIIDPAVPMKNEAFILVKLERELEPLLRQLKYLHAKAFLHALNPRYPQILFGDRDLYCGTVKQLIVQPKW